LRPGKLCSAGTDDAPRTLAHMLSHIVDERGPDTGSQSNITCINFDNLLLAYLAICFLLSLRDRIEQCALGVAVGLLIAP
jgi:hypothetical protein